MYTHTPTPTLLERIPCCVEVFVKQLNAFRATLSSCIAVARIDITGNHCSVIVLRIWECVELKNVSVSGSISPAIFVLCCSVLFARSSGIKAF